MALKVRRPDDSRIPAVPAAPGYHGIAQGAAPAPPEPLRYPLLDREGHCDFDDLSRPQVSVRLRLDLFKSIHLDRPTDAGCDCFLD